MIAVGDSGTIELVFTAYAQQRGKVRKSASVTVNDNSQGSFPISMGGEVYAYQRPDSLRPVALSQSRIDFKPDTRRDEIRLKITNFGDSDIRVSPVSVPKKEFELEFPSSSIKPGKTKEIKVRMKRDYGDEGFKKSFTFELDDPARTRYTVPVEYNTHVRSSLPQIDRSQPEKRVPWVDTTKTVDRKAAPGK